MINIHSQPRSWCLHWENGFIQTCIHMASCFQPTNLLQVPAWTFPAWTVIKAEQQLWGQQMDATLGVQTCGQRLHKENQLVMSLLTCSCLLLIFKVFQVSVAFQTEFNGGVWDVLHTLTLAQRVTLLSPWMNGCRRLAAVRKQLYFIG